MVGWLLLTGGLMVVIGVVVHIYTRIKLRPPPEVDEIYHEFQEQDVLYRRYLLWYRITVGLIAIGAIFLLLATLFLITTSRIISLYG